jgi:uncharacterized protein with ParB-like and HNH nuclease domain
MDDIFKPLSLTINKLFCDAEDAFYQIPKYQRPYKWVDEQVEKLWEDIYTAYQNNEPYYFLGSIITVKDPEQKSLFLDVVDGQQRLTTLMILFCVFRDLYPEINEKFSEDPSIINSTTIKNAILFQGKSKRLKLITHPQHQSDFDNYILNGNTTLLKKPNKKELKIDEEPYHKFINTACIFSEKLGSLGEDESAKILNFIFNNIKVIKIICWNRNFAITLFQVLNDRGLDLTPSDIIKSFLLDKIQKEYKNEKETLKRKEEQFIQDWITIEHIAKDTGENINDLFTIYQYYLLAQNPEKSLTDELQKQFKDKDTNEIIQSFKKFAETYKREIFSKTDKVIYSFYYLKWTVYWKSILLTALTENYKDYEKIKILLRKFYYLYWIAGKTLSAIKQTSFNLIKWIKENREYSEIEKEINGNIEKILKQAIESLSNNIADEPWTKPLLILMEYNSTDDAKLSSIELNRDLHLEHVLPKKYNNFKEWNYITKDIADKWLESGGNLTLLSGSKNIEASDNPFSIKMSIYNGKGKYGDKDTKITSFNISQSIFRDYESNIFNGQWNEVAIKKRWEWFCNEITALFNIDTSIIKNK